MPEIRVRLVSINTWKCDGDYFQRMDALERQLAALEPDLILLQEAFAIADGSVDTAARLGHRLGLNRACVPERRKARSLRGEMKDSYSGLAILSRWKIDSHRALSLPSSPQDGGRSAQLAMLRFGECAMVVANVHLSYLPNGGALRRQQLTTLLEYAAGNIDYTAMLIAGDFNAALTDPELRPFLQPPWNLVDAFAAGGGGVKITYRDPDGHESNLDHIVAVPDRQGGLPVFCDSRLVLDVPDSLTGTMPSDHLGVMTTVVLDG